MQADSGSGVAGGGLVLRQVGDSGTGAQTQTIQVDADGQIIGKDTVRDTSRWKAYFAQPPLDCVNLSCVPIQPALRNNFRPELCYLNRFLFLPLTA